MSKTKALSFFILGYINVKPRTGYELKKICQLAAHEYYVPPIRQIYVILKRLEKRGLITKTREVTDTKLLKRYHITEKGFKKFKEWLTRPTKPENFSLFEYEFTTKLVFNKYLSTEELKKLLIHYKKAIQEIIKKDEKAYSVFQINDMPKDYEYGLHIQRIKWCDKLLTTLDKK